MQKLVNDIFDKYKFNDYPGDYKKVLVQVIEEAISIFGDNLLNMTLGGSGGKNKIHPGWSDLDIYFILNNYDVAQITRFMSVEWCCDIHVGTTYYTLSEVKNNILDGKTKIMLYEKQNYGINPTIYGEDYFPIINFDIVKTNDFNNLPNTLHLVRRSYINVKNGSYEIKKSDIKKLLVLMKCILSMNGKFVYGYEEVFVEFYKLDCGLTKQNADAIIKIIRDINSSTAIYLDVCDDVFNYLEKFLGGK